MKTVRYSQDALLALRRNRNVASLIMQKIRRYAETGAGDVKRLVASDGASRLRVGDFRVIFEESSGEILVTKIAHRSSAYD